MIKVALVGGSGGIGAALLSQLSDRADIASINCTYLRSPAQGSQVGVDRLGADVDITWSQVDVTNDQSVKQWLANVGELDWLINCAGFLHDATSAPEKSIAQFDSDCFEKNMRINCLPNLLLAKYAARALKASDKGIFASITAKVGSIEDNQLGGWYSYRASKAAANMVLKSLSIEWMRTAPKVRVVALHPGTTDTKLSAPFQSRVAPGKLFSAEQTAAYLLTQLDQLHDFPSGRFIAYDGEELPW